MSTDTVDQLASRCRFVLVRPTHPGNIGSAARAIRTMGFTRLELVAPDRFPDPQANAMATHATTVLKQARVCERLVDALTGATCVFGLSARRREVRSPELDPREAAARAWIAASHNQQVALLFGNERTGLANDELAPCHAMVRIPSVDDCSSLNLAQAVQVMAYELRMARPDDASRSTRHDCPLADAVQMERFYQHLGQTLDDIDFHKGRSPKTIMLRLRRLFQRTQPDQRELRVLHGILADAQRMADLAGRGKNKAC